MDLDAQKKRQTRIIRALADFARMVREQRVDIDYSELPEIKPALILGCLPCKCCSGVSVAK